MVFYIFEDSNLIDNKDLEYYSAMDSRPKKLKSIKPKVCIVPKCNSVTGNSNNATNKVFFKVPVKKELKEKWKSAVGGFGRPVSEETNIYCCEDHFDLHEDTSKFMSVDEQGQYGVDLKLKSNVVPHRFECQNLTENNVEMIPKDNMEENSLILNKAELQCDGENKSVQCSNQLNHINTLTNVTIGTDEEITTNLLNNNETLAIKNQQSFSDANFSSCTFHNEIEIKNKQLLAICKPVKIELCDLKHAVNPKITSLQETDFNELNDDPIVMHMSLSGKRKRLKCDDKKEDDLMKRRKLTPKIFGWEQNHSKCIAIHDRQCKELEIYYLNSNSDITTYKRFYNIENSTLRHYIYELEFKGRKNRLKVIDCCCWFYRENFRPSIEFTKKSHRCEVYNYCSCCCRNIPRISHNMPNSSVNTAESVNVWVNETVTNYRSLFPQDIASFNAIKKALIDIRDVQDKCMRINNKQYDSFAIIIDNVYYKIDNGFITFYMKHQYSVELSNYESDINSKVCCWYKQEQLADDLLKRYKVPSSTVKFIRSQHLCPTKQCKCCCKPKCNKNYILPQNSLLVRHTTDATLKNVRIKISFSNVPEANLSTSQGLNAKCIGSSSCTSQTPNTKSIGLNTSAYQPLHAKSIGLNSSASQPLHDKSIGLNSSASQPLRAKSIGLNSSASQPLRAKSIGLKSSASKPLRAKSIGLNSSASQPLHAKSIGLSSSATQPLNAKSVGLNSSASQPHNAKSISSNSSATQPLNAESVGLNLSDSQPLHAQSISLKSSASQSLYDKFIGLNASTSMALHAKSIGLKSSASQSLYAKFIGYNASASKDLHAKSIGLNSSTYQPLYEKQIGLNSSPSQPLHAKSVGLNSSASQPLHAKSIGLNSSTYQPLHEKQIGLKSSPSQLLHAKSVGLNSSTSQPPQAKSIGLNSSVSQPLRVKPIGLNSTTGKMIPSNRLNSTLPSNKAFSETINLTDVPKSALENSGTPITYTNNIALDLDSTLKERLKTPFVWNLINKTVTPSQGVSTSIVAKTIKTENILDSQSYSANDSTIEDIDKRASTSVGALTDTIISNIIKETNSKHSSSKTCNAASASTCRCKASHFNVAPSSSTRVAKNDKAKNISSIIVTSPSMSMTTVTETNSNPICKTTIATPSESVIDYIITKAFKGITTPPPLVPLSNSNAQNTIKDVSCCTFTHKPKKVPEDVITHNLIGTSSTNVPSASNSIRSDVRASTGYVDKAITEPVTAAQPKRSMIQILERLKNVRISNQKRGLSAQLDTPLNNLSTTELKILNSIMIVMENKIKSAGLADDNVQFNCDSILKYMTSRNDGQKPSAEEIETNIVDVNCAYSSEVFKSSKSFNQTCFINTFSDFVETLKTQNKISFEGFENIQKHYESKSKRVGNNKSKLSSLTPLDALEPKICERKKRE